MQIKCIQGLAHASTALSESLAYMRNCKNMKPSSTMVPKDPINHGRFVMMYSLSREWSRMLAPYVILPIRDRTKNRRDKPARVR